MSTHSRLFLLTLLMLSLSLPAGALAQGPPPGPRGAGGPPPPGLEGRIFPPDMIIHFQRELALTEAQRKTITKEVQGLQTRVVELHFNLQREVDTLSRLLDHDRIDEAKALAQSGKVMTLEREIKQLHLKTLIRIKNVLNAKQIAKLKKLAPPRPPRPPMPPGGRP